MLKEAMLYEKLEGGRVHCFLCAHECKISESKLGVCGVRQNLDGTLYTTVYGDVIAANVDPIEKKPLYHFLPGSRSFSIATFGCNFKCSFCQNWQISQVRPGEVADQQVEREEVTLSPEEVVEKAGRYGCASVSYTYTEPTIFFEYAYDTARLAREQGLANVFVTNGYMTKQALEAIAPYLNAANVDLKSFRDDYYKTTCKARLQPVLDSIEYIKKLGIWLEVTTLVVPGENDSDEELDQIASFISGVDTEIPWHISRFRPDYEMMDHEATPIERLHKARDIGRRNGLSYVYLGNVMENADTYCPRCGEPVLERTGRATTRNNIQNGACASCGTLIAGVWESPGAPHVASPSRKKPD